MKEVLLKMKYERPDIEIVMFIAEDIITTSADYKGINFDDLI